MVFLASPQIKKEKENLSTRRVIIPPPTISKIFRRKSFVDTLILDYQYINELMQNPEFLDDLLILGKYFSCQGIRGLEVNIFR